MTKFKAASIHFLFSLLFISAFVLWVYFIWYDQIFVAISGVIEPIKLLVLVDVILGPILTFIVYKAGKKRLKLDLTIILLVQLAAFAYGGLTLFNGKPTLVVMKGSLLEVVVQKEVKSELFPAAFKNDYSPFFKPIYVRTEPAKQSVLASARSQQGILQPLDFSASDVIDKFIPIDRLSTLEGLEKERLDLILGDKRSDLLKFYPLIYNKEYAAFVVDELGQPVVLVETDEQVIYMNN